MDKKVTQLPHLTVPDGNDRLYIIDNPTGTAVSKQITLDRVFGNVNSNTVLNRTLAVAGNTVFNGISTFANTVNVSTRLNATDIRTTGNGIIIENKFTPGVSTLDNASYPMGKITFDTNYMYIKVANTTIKRIALSSF